MILTCCGPRPDPGAGGRKRIMQGVARVIRRLVAAADGADGEQPGWDLAQALTGSLWPESRFLEGKVMQKDEPAPRVLRSLILPR